MNQVKVLSRIPDEKLAEVAGGKEKDNISGSIAKGIIKGAAVVLTAKYLYDVADDYSRHYAEIYFDSRNVAQRVGANLRRAIEVDRSLYRKAVEASSEGLFMAKCYAIEKWCEYQDHQHQQ